MLFFDFGQLEVPDVKIALFVDCSGAVGDKRFPAAGGDRSIGSTERLHRRKDHFTFAERFFNEWIPLENKYFSHIAIKEQCDLVIKITE